MAKALIKNTDYLVTKRIQVGKYFNADEDVSIELRELGGVDAAKLTKAYRTDEIAGMQLFVEHLPDIIVDHDFWKDEAHKLTAAEVAFVVAAKAELCLDLMGKYAGSVLFPHRKENATK